MPSVWTPEANARLFAATLAASQTVPSSGVIAKYFGQGSTYDSIEGQLRKHKALAKQLETEAAANGTEVAKPGRFKKATASSGSGSISHSARSGTAATNSTAPRGKKRTNSGRQKTGTTPTKSSNSVISGRVSKSTSKSITPTATRKATKLENSARDIKMESDYEFKDLMDKESTDEVFSLSSYDGSIDDYVMDRS